MIARIAEATINEITETDLDRPTEEMPPFAHPDEELPTQLRAGDQLPGARGYSELHEWADAKPADLTTTDADSGDRLLGTMLHGMRIEKLIGEGSAARIYHAVHRVLDREYALKILHADTAENRGHVERLKREARLLSRIRHPNIVEVFDFGETASGQPFIAMEMLRGKTLKTVIEHEAPLSRDRALSLAKQITLGIQEAHRIGLVHRDLKPENVMLVGDRGNETAKILDFGLVRVFKATEHKKSEALTGIDILLGTPRYMAPEQILSPSSAGPTSDLYALGVMLYEMLTGKPPFNGAVFEVIEQQLNRAPDPLAITDDRVRSSLARSSVRASGASSFMAKSGALERIVMGLLDKDPTARPRSATQVLALLNEATPDRSPTRLRTPPQPLPALKQKTSRFPLVALCLVGFAFMLLAGFFAGQRLTQPVVLLLPDQPRNENPSPR